MLSFVLFFFFCFKNKKRKETKSGGKKKNKKGGERQKICVCFFFSFLFFFFSKNIHVPNFAVLRLINRFLLFAMEAKLVRCTFLYQHSSSTFSDFSSSFFFLLLLTYFKYVKAVAPLKSALSLFQTGENNITPVHACLAQVCFKEKEKQKQYFFFYISNSAVFFFFKKTKIKSMCKHRPA